MMADPRIDSGGGGGDSGPAPKPSGNPYDLAENRAEVKRLRAMQAIANLLAQYPGSEVIDENHIRMPNGRIRTIEVDADGNPVLSDQWTEGESKDWLEANGYDAGPGGTGSSGGSSARLASDDPRYWADIEAERQLERDRDARSAFEFDITTEEGRRQWDMDYNRGIQNDAAKIGVDYATLNQNERQFVQEMAYNYYNAFNDAETGRRQALATLINARNQNVTDLARLQKDISSEWAQLAANPRDAFAEINYRAATGNATPFGSTSSGEFQSYEQSANDKVKQIFGPAGNMLQNAYQYATQPIPSEYLNPVQRPPTLEAPKQILPPALNLPLAQHASNPNPVARALLSLQDLGVNNYSAAEKAALAQIAGGQPQPVQPNINQFAADQYTKDPEAFRKWIEATKGMAKGGTVNVKPLKMATGGTVYTGPPPTPKMQALRTGIESVRAAGGKIPTFSVKLGPPVDDAYRAKMRQYELDYRAKLAAQGRTADYPSSLQPTPLTTPLNNMAEVGGPNLGAPALTPLGGSNTVAAGQAEVGGPNLSVPGPALNDQLPEHLQRPTATPFKLDDGGTLDFESLYSSRDKDGFSPSSSEGGLNTNIHERAIILGESGKIYATLGERRPDGSIRSEQLMVKPLKSEVDKDKKMEEQNKQAVESQKETLKAFANGGGATVTGGGQDLMLAIRNMLKSQGIEQQGQQLPDPRLLAPLYGRLTQDQDLYSYLQSAYSARGVSPNNLDYSLKQFQPQQLQGVPQVSYR